MIYSFWLDFCQKKEFIAIYTGKIIKKTLIFLQKNFYASMKKE